jgi:membrane associated rhomboid family serine protease
VFYLLSGLAASLFFVWTSPGLQVPLVGASGAIAGVLGAYLVSFPHAKVATLIWFGFFIRVVYIPALVVLGLWFVLQVLSGLPTVGSEEQSGGVAFMAHAGGFVAGMLLVWLMTKRRGSEKTGSDSN